jgi:Zn-dependent peptidase ImmA (M78 family)
MTPTEKQQFLKNMKTFLALAKNELNLEKLPKIYWITGDYSTKNSSFGGFLPRDQSIRVVISDRHPNDVMRTLAHELTHYRQWLDGELKPNSGETGSPQENEANAKAGVIMRNYNHSNNSAFIGKTIR